MTYTSFLNALSGNGLQFVNRFFDYCERYGVTEPDLRFDYLEFKLCTAVKRGLISESESDFIFDYFTLHDC